MTLKRRHVLGLLAAPLATALHPVAAAEHPLAAGSVPIVRTLSFEHLHTAERLRVAYFDDGRYVPDALDAVNRLLRDFRTGDVAPIDPALLDVLHALGRVAGANAPFQIISGYRSPATNATLHARSAGVASGSLHMRGQAIDIRVPGLPLDVLRDAALSLRAGGVGYYAASGFVHVDTGRVRRW